MKIEIESSGMFIHEVEAIEKIKKAFTMPPAVKSEPSQSSSMQDSLIGAGLAEHTHPMFPWKGYAGFRFIDVKGNDGEFDLVIVTHANIIIVELKHYNRSKITDYRGAWYQGDRPEPSPVAVTRRKEFVIRNKLEPLRHKFKNGKNPFVTFLVVMTGNATFSDLSENEKKYVVTLEEFLLLADQTNFNLRFKPRRLEHKISSDFELFDGLCIGKGVEPKNLTIHGYKLILPSIFKHPKNLYEEFGAKSENEESGLIRAWDFDKSGEPHLQTPGGRFRVLSTEQDILKLIKQSDDNLYQNCLRPLKPLEKDEVISRYHEVYEIPYKHQRFNNYIATYGGNFSKSDRLTLVKLLTDRVSKLHEMNIAHLDLGDQSLWIGDGKNVKLSNFMSANNSAKQNNDYDNSNAVNKSYLGDFFPFTQHAVTAFKEDIRTLAMISWHIFNGERTSSKSLESFYESVADCKDWYSDILKRALDGNTYTTATEYFDAIKQHEPFNEQTFDFDNTKLDKYQKDIKLDRFYPPNKIILDSHEKEIWLSGEEIVTSWPIDLLKNGVGYKALAFLQKIERIKSISPAYLPQINDFGIDSKRRDLFVVTSQIEGQAWGELELDLNLCWGVIAQLIAAVKRLHEIGVAHGNLRPDNILVLHTDNTMKLIITSIPESGLPDGKKTSSFYLHESLNKYTIEEIDNIDVMHMSRDLLSRSGHDSDTSFGELHESINKEFGDSLFGFKSLDRFSQLLKPNLPLANKPLLITVKNDFEGLIIYPDNGSLYVTVETNKRNPAEVRVSFAGVGGSIDLIYGKAEFLVGFKPNRWDSVPRNREDNHQLVLEFAIEIQSGQYNDLSQLTQRLQNHEEFLRAINLTMLLPVIPAHADPLNDALKEEFARMDNIDLVAESKYLQITTQKLWKAVLDTEIESYPHVDVFEVASLDDYRDAMITYSSDVNVLGEFDKKEAIELFKKTEDRDVFLGKLVWAKSTNENLYVTKVQNGLRALKYDDVVYLRTEGDKASFDKRKLALERLLDGDGLIGNLVDYFDPSCDLDVVKYDITVSEQDFDDYNRIDAYGKKISFNKKQKAAFIKILQNGPLSLLQGPPGTGKTEFIAAFVHFLLEKQGVQKILLVSSSHVAVDTAAERIRQHCKRLNSELHLVRFSSSEEKVSTGLKDVYSKTLTSEVRELFRAEIKYRCAGLAKAYGVQPDYLVDVVDAELRVFVHLDEYDAELKSIAETERIEDEESSNRPSLLDQELSIREVLKARFDIHLTPEDDLSGVKDKVMNNLNYKYSINPHEFIKAQALANISRSMLAVLETDRVNYDEFFARSKQLITGTCVGIGRYNINIKDNQYDWVIIDEASRANAGELAIAMQSGKRVLLVGDHKQLSPNIEKPHLKALSRKLGIPEASFSKVIQSDFERAFLSNYGRQTSAALFTQYRMAPAIGQLVSDVFYDGNLENGARTVPHFYADGPEFINNVVTWIDTSRLGEQSYHQANDHKISNRCEVDLIIKMLRQLSIDQSFIDSLKGLVNEDEYAIGVICTYAEQVRILKKSFNENLWSDEFKSLVNIATVDSYQGKENRIVILSLTRASQYKDPGFLRIPNRINVALSRAMDRLIIVGSSEMWKEKNKDLPLGKIVSFMKSIDLKGQYAFIKHDVIQVKKEVGL